MTLAPPRPEQRSELEAQALFEQARRRRRRRRLFVAIAVITLAVIAVASILAATGPADNHAPPPYLRSASHTGVPPSDQAMPSQMVVWAQSGGTMSVQIINSHSGKVERTLSEDVGLFRMSPDPSAAPDGTVYYDAGVTGVKQGPDARPPVEEILSVPITGGTPKVVAVGHHPAVSPDGRYLAYLTWTDLTNAPEGVAVLDRQTGAVTTWQYSTTTPDISKISWAPDSKSLVVVADTLTGNSSHLSVGQLALTDPLSTSLESLPQIQRPLCPPPTQWAGPGANREMAWGGFFNAREGIGICQQVELSQPDDRSQAVIFDLATGRLVRKLPVVPGLIGGFESDPSGHHLIFIGGGVGAGGLYRWTVDTTAVRQARPVLVKERVGSGSWVPARAG